MGYVILRKPVLLDQVILMRNVAWSIKYLGAREGLGQ